MNEREKLPNRRAAEIFDLMAGTAAGQEIPYTVQIGYYPDGRMGELFLRSGRAGSDLNVLAMEIAVAVSFALQYGCPVETMRSAVPRRSDGAPEGVLGALLDRLAMDQEREKQAHAQAKEAKRAALAVQQEASIP
jgi:hypothetical protein